MQPVVPSRLRTPGLRWLTKVGGRLGRHGHGSSLACWLALLMIGVLWTATPSRAEPEQPDRPLWHEADEEGSLRVRLYLFWSESCPHCHRALGFVDDLVKELPWLDVRLLEISDPDSAEAYAVFANAFGIEASYVPAFFYCGKTFAGYSSDQTTGKFLRETLEGCYTELKDDQTVATDPGHPEEPLSQPPISLPLIGAFDPGSLSLPIMTIVLGGLDAFNPCAFFVLLFLLSLMVHVRKRIHMAIVLVAFAVVVTAGLVRRRRTRDNHSEPKEERP